MTPEEMMLQFKRIRGNNCHINFGLEQPELKLKVGLYDKVAADLLEWMSEQYPQLTRQETLAILQSAAWWVVFFGALCE